MSITYDPLRQLMREKGISYRQLRAELGLHSRITTRMKNDSGYVSLHTIDLLCEYFDVSVQEIIRYEER